MYVKVYFILCISILFLRAAYSQRFNLPRIPCVDRYSGSRGLCSYYNNCFYAQVLYEYQRITPTICGYKESYPVVCCPYSEKTSSPRPSNNVNGDFTYPENSNSNNSPSNQDKNQEKAKRISEKKCDEYSLKVKRVVQAWTLSANPETLTHRQSSTCDYSNPLIVGGEDANLAEFPHMAAIGWQNTDNGYNWLCAGSLISKNYVLTAAHCTIGKIGFSEPSVVRLGDHNLKINSEGANPQDIDIAGITQHPNYQYPSKYNDIALLRLEISATLNKFVRPACLWQGDIKDEQKVIVTGWGTTSSGETSDVLQKVTIGVINQQRCSGLYSITRQLLKGIVDEQLCAGIPEGGKDACQGDSGGPLQTTKTNECIFYIVGITSFGKGCAAPNTPGIYTRVSKYVTWIENIVWPGE